MQFKQLCEDWSIRTWSSGSKYCSTGHLQLDCPWCDNSKGPHLSWHLTKHYFNCWSCGWNPTPKVLVALLDMSYQDAKRLIHRYRGKERDLYVRDEQDDDRPTKIKVPGSKELASGHKKYLKDRGYNPDELQSTWDLRATSIGGEYKHRIIAPIYYRGRIVSYQGRDITNRSILRWKACRKDKEILDHQKLLYGIDDAPTNHGILVEGVSDVWKMGVGSMGSFGMLLSKEQAKLLKRFSKLFIVFDPEPQAQKLARDLARYLNLINIETYNIKLDGDKDPGALTRKEVREVKKELLGII